MPETALIGLDWGTTALRAYRLDAAGGILEQRHGAAGILALAGGGFEAAFETAVAGWPRNVPVLASGMITSRQGWLECPYLGCPADAEALAGALRTHVTGGGRRLHLITGLTITGDDGVPDVMRGEETQIIGALDDHGDDHGDDDDNRGPRLLVLPGTHSKWALAEAGRITWFATFMTGELFAVLKAHSILGRMMDGEAEDAAARQRGLAYGLAGDAGSGGLLRRLFSARTLALFGALPETAVAAYLSGLLLGAEMGEAMACVSERSGLKRVTVLGETALAGHYAQAIEVAGLAADRGPAHAAARGHWRIAVAAGLIACR